MNGIFTVRIKPNFGESLSGYIMRMALANGIDVKYILRHMLITNNRANGIDSLNKYSKQLKLLSQLTNVDVEALSNMSFAVVYEKLTDDIENKKKMYKKMLSSEIISDKRRFCMDCLREYGVYRLIWQVRDIQICDKHLTKLTSKCNCCGTEQPYIIDDLGAYKCAQCSSELNKYNNDLISDKMFISNQLRLYEKWNYLLDPTKILFTNQDGMQKEKSFAIATFYACQRGENIFNINILKKYFNKRFLYSILHMIIDGSGSYMTVQHLFRIIDSVHLSIDEFSQIVVSNSYKESLMSYFQSNEMLPGICKSPWCSYYGSTSKMKQVKHNGFHEQTHSLACVCTGCYMAYGYNKKTGEWESIDGIATLIGDYVLPLLKSGITKKDIFEKTGLGINSISRAIGYIASHELCEYDVVAKYTPAFTPKNIVRYFEKLINIKGAMIRNAKKEFNWDINEFYYFFSLDIVQEYLISNLYIARKEYKSDGLEKKIYSLSKHSLNVLYSPNSNIAKKLNISERAFYYNNLNKVILKIKDKRMKLEYDNQEKEIKKKVNEFLCTKEKNVEKTSCKAVYNYIDKSYNWMAKYNPQLIRWIYKQVNHFNEKIKYLSEKHLADLIENTIKEIYDNGELPTNKKISNKIGIKLGRIQKSKFIRGDT